LYIDEGDDLRDRQILTKYDEDDYPVGRQTKAEAERLAVPVLHMPVGVLRSSVSALDNCQRSWVKVRILHLTFYPGLAEKSEYLPA
jgi:hypothetical protein